MAAEGGATGGFAQRGGMGRRRWVPRIRDVSPRAEVESIPVDDLFVVSAPAELREDVEGADASLAARSFSDDTKQVLAVLMTSERARIPRDVVGATTQRMGSAHWTAGADASVWWGGKIAGTGGDLMVVTRAGRATMFLRVSAWAPSARPISAPWRPGSGSCFPTRWQTKLRNPVRRPLVEGSGHSPCSACASGPITLVRRLRRRRAAIEVPTPAAELDQMTSLTVSLGHVVKFNRLSVRPESGEPQRRRWRR